MKSGNLYTIHDLIVGDYRISQLPSENIFTNLSHRLLRLFTNSKQMAALQIW